MIFKPTVFNASGTPSRKFTLDQSVDVKIPSPSTKKTKKTPKPVNLL